MHIEGPSQSCIIHTARSSVNKIKIRNMILSTDRVRPFQGNCLTDQCSHYINLNTVHQIIKLNIKNLDTLIQIFSHVFNWAWRNSWKEFMVSLLQSIIDYTSNNHVMPILSILNKGQIWVDCSRLDIVIDIIICMFFPQGRYKTLDIRNKI